jgi:hypothetical protein
MIDTFLTLPHCPNDSLLVEWIAAIPLFAG